MTRFFIIRNAYKAPVKRVFDYLEFDELKNPNEKQKSMLSEICDGIDFFEEEDENLVKKNMKEGDYLYRVFYNNTTQLICIYPPVKLKKGNG